MNVKKKILIYIPGNLTSVKRKTNVYSSFHMTKNSDKTRYYSVQLSKSDESLSHYTLPVSYK